MAATVITVGNISKSFGKIQAVRDLSFSVESGSCFGFLGPNGAGKTTVMKIIYGKCTRDKDHDSEMDIFGYDPATNELAIKYLSGVVQQENNLDGDERGLPVFGDQNAAGTVAGRNVPDDELK